jgi:mRNA interferase RelE/StbE
MFEVILSPEAQEFFAAVDRPLAKKIARCFVQLEREPRRHNSIKLLTGKLAGRRRYRIGDWRVIFSIDAERNLVFVLSIAHRREIYE